MWVTPKWIQQGTPTPHTRPQGFVTHHITSSLQRWSRWTCVASTRTTLVQLDSGVVSSRVNCVTSEQKAWCQDMDKVMKRLGIELASDGQDAIPMVHCNVDGRQCVGGRTTWLTTFQGYAFKSNPIIDDIHN